MEYMQLNEFQTPFEELHLDELPDEVLELFWDFINNVPFIKGLISKDRPRAKDLPRDDLGKIIVDIAHPHILENMEYFTETADFYKKNGKFTNYRPNPNPNSPYMQWFKREIYRCWYGCVRPEDGEWIPGNMYFYLNFYQIQLLKKRKDAKGQLKKSNRVVDFPRVWEGVYWRYHYIEQAQNGGIYNNWEGGEGGCEISSRGKAHPYSQIVYTPDGIKKWKDIKIGDYLYGDDGNLTKIIDIPFDDEDDIYKITLKDGRTVMASGQHLWKVFKRHDDGKIKIMSTLDMMKKLYFNRKVSYRNPNGKEYIYSIPANKGVNWKFVKTKVDPYTFGLLLGDGCFRNEKLKNVFRYTSRLEDVKTYLKYIPYEITKVKPEKEYSIKFKNAKQVLIDYGLFMKKSEDKFIPNEFKFNSKEVRLNILKGLMDSDGFVDSNGIPIIGVSSKRLANDIEFIARSLGFNCLRSIKPAGYKNKNGEYKKCLDSYIVRIYTDLKIFNLERKYSLISKFKTQYQRSNKDYSTIVNIEFSHREKAKCVTVDNESDCYLIGDFITTHNSKSYSMAAILVKYFTMGESEDVKEAVKALVVAAQKEYLTADGILNKYLFGCDFLILRPELQLPKQRIKSSLTDMEWKSGYTDLNTKTEVGTLNETFGVTTKDNVGKVRGKRMLFIAVEEFGSFPNVLEMYNIMKLSWIEGDEAFGFIYLIGTSGEKESDFAGAAEIVYNPKGYRMYALPNVWDKEGLGKKEITFFFPGYINYAGCYNDNGTSDVTKSLLRILIDRYNVKYNSTDINTITRTIAEVPITPQEALLRVKSNFFPTAQLNERINQLDANPSIYDDIYTGTLVFDANNEVIFQPTNAVPIRNFPHDANNKEEGTLEIFSLPQKNNNGKVIENRYIAGIDPYDLDNSETMSLYSMFVLDLFTDRIVAEYTGRPKFADEAYELTRKLLLFYNAKGCYENNLKGLYAYFKTMKCTHLLCDTPEYLKGKELWKLGNYGNLTKGIRATAPINNYANLLIRDWLLQPVVVERKAALGDNSNLEETNEVTIPLLYTLRNRALLKELALYNPIINVDRIRALGMLMLYREEKIILYNGDLSNIGDLEEIDKDYLGNDEYFSKNYDNKFGNKEVMKFLQRN